MPRALAAALFYFFLLFAVGFVLGTVRVIVVAPQIGDLAATVLELPLMLGAAYVLCRWSIRTWRVPAVGRQRWAMAVAFMVLLLIFEAGLGVLLFGRGLPEQWASLKTVPGLLGLAAQLVAAVLPVFLARLPGAPGQQKI